MVAEAACTNLQVAASACQVYKAKQSALKFQCGEKCHSLSFFCYFHLVRKCKMHERSPEGEISIEESLKDLFK